MPPPEVATLTARMYARLPEIYRLLDARHDYPLLRYLSLIGDRADELETLWERLDGVPTSDLTDPATADPVWLPWLQQLVGLSDRSGSATAEDRRAAVAAAGTEHFPGGSLAHLRAAVERELGAGSARVQKRVGDDPFTVNVYTPGLAQTATWALLEESFPTWWHWDGAAWSVIESQAAVWSAIQRYRPAGVRIGLYAAFDDAVRTLADHAYAAFDAENLAHRATFTDAAGSTVEVADHPSYDVGADLDVRVCAKTTWLDPNYDRMLAARFNMTQAGAGMGNVFTLQLGLVSSGRLVFRVRNNADNSTGIATASAIVPGFGAVRLVRAHAYVSGGNVKVRFYYRPYRAGAVDADLLDDAGWTQIGTEVTTSPTITTIRAASALPYTLGNDASRSRLGLNGEIYGSVFKRDGQVKSHVHFDHGAAGDRQGHAVALFGATQVVPAPNAQLDDVVSTATARELSAVVGGAKPVFVNAGGTWVIRFNGHGYATAAFGEALAPPNLVLALARFTSAGERWVYDGIDAANRHALLRRSDANLEVHGGEAVALDRDPGAAWHVYLVYHAGADSRVYVDGNLAYADDLGDDALTGLTLAARYDQVAPTGDLELGYLAALGGDLLVSDSNLLNQAGHALAQRVDGTWNDVAP